jgi:hypothetical protein
LGSCRGVACKANGIATSAISPTPNSRTRQSATNSSSVPSTGPAAGTIASIIAMAAMPRTPSCAGSVARMTVGDTTVDAPAAMPCNNRMASNEFNSGARALPTLDATSSHSPAFTQARGPKRCSASPHTSWEHARPARNTAMVAWP